jgi:MFS family permease
MEETEKEFKVFYGWWIVLVSFIVHFLTLGIVFYTFGVFLKPLAEFFKWSRTEVSLAHSLQVVVVALIVPLVGRLTDRFGSKKVLIPGAAFLGAGYIILHWLTALWQFYLIYIIMGLGYAAFGFIPLATLINNWFQKRKGLAMSISVVGIGLGGFLMAPFSNYLISSLGWRSAYLILGLLFCLVGLPLVLLLVRNRPSEMGLLPYGEKAVGLPETTAAANPGGLTLAEALGTLRFWLFTFAFGVAVLGNVGALVHMVPYATDKGFSSQTAASALGLMTGFSIFARLGYGYLADRFEIRYLIMISFLFIASGMVILMAANSVYMLYTFSLVFALGIGGIIVLLNLVPVKSFGQAHYAEILSYLHVALTVGAALGPPATGYIFDVTGDYYWAFIPGIVLVLMAAIAVFFARTPQQRVLA